MGTFCVLCSPGRLVAHKVRFKCSDRDVVAEHHESILEAAIRAGLNVDYGCNNGNCGRCAARLLEGEIQEIRHYDRVQSAAEKARQEFLMCSYAAASDLVVDAHLGDPSKVISTQSLRAKVRGVKKFSDVCIVSLRTPRSTRLRFLAGQYAHLSGSHFGKVQCSIASCPCEDQRLEFHVPRTRGEFSDYVFKACRVGDQWDVMAPYGKFIFREDPRRAAVMVVFETGFAPVKSLIEHIAGQEEEVSLHLYWVTAADKPYLDNLCRAWSDAFDHFAYTPMAACDPDGGEAAQVCAQRIAGEHPDLSASDVYICAPPPFANVVAQACLERDLDPACLFREVLRRPRC